MIQQMIPTVPFPSPTVVFPYVRIIMPIKEQTIAAIFIPVSFSFKIIAEKKTSIIGHR